METSQILKSIYDKYRKKYRSNPDSGQLCCMWSTINPPGDIYNSDQILSIEKAFGIDLSEDEALELYDMELEEAVKRIEAIIRNQC
jgi:hypothetical protein